MAAVFLFPSSSTISPSVMPILFMSFADILIIPRPKSPLSVSSPTFSLRSSLIKYHSIYELYVQYHYLSCLRGFICPFPLEQAPQLFRVHHYLHHLAMHLFMPLVKKLLHPLHVLHRYNKSRVGDLDMRHFVEQSGPPVFVALAAAWNYLVPSVQLSEKLIALVIRIKLVSLRIESYDDR